MLLTINLMRIPVLRERSESKGHSDLVGMDVFSNPRKDLYPERPLIPTVAEGSGARDLFIAKSCVLAS